MSLLSKSTFIRQLNNASVIYTFVAIAIIFSLSTNSLAKEFGAEGFSVQVGAFSDPSPSTIALAKNINGDEVYGYLQANLNRYYIGRYETREIAEKNLQLIRNSCFPDAFLAAYSENFQKIDNVSSAIALGSTSSITESPRETSNDGSSFLLKPTTPTTPTTTASPVNQASVANIEAALSSLSQSDRENVVMMNGRLWLKEGKNYKSLPLS